MDREHTLATTCQKIWIPVCRELIRKVLHDCLYCKNERIKLTPASQERFTTTEIRH